MEYKLTDEGREYLAKGLPEKRLVESIDKDTGIKEAKSKVENFSIALSWAKKNGWVKLEKGMIKVLKRPGKIPEQDALEAVSKGKPVDSETLNTLLKRKLIAEDRETESKKAMEMVGKEVTNLTPELIKTGVWKDVKLKPYNVRAVGSRVYPGKRQPYNQFLDSVRAKLVSLGFKEMTGPHIETEFWNFDALYQAQNHPSRDWTQTYALKHPTHGDLPDKKIVDRVKATHENGWETGSTGWGYEWDPKKASNLMPRAHTTACSARRIAQGVDVPGKYFAISRCFRPDVIDATHGVEFNQAEGIVIDEGLTFRDMLGLLEQFAVEMAGAEKVKFYPDYYPFTEPSVQVSVKHPDLGWIEIAGAGIFRPELTEPLGLKQPVIAWGFGIDRLAMYKLGIVDIRELFSRNLQWLRNSRIIR
ncbi:MAG: phenylalanine--tRNA ligase subunit alpha [Candidatus Aenigmatarchaeota archaeon]|nr:MAG: phenylalanine--tRNA ligase subunit alpha [Candidatus Aenigmarchaeota archaeon]